MTYKRPFPIPDNKTQTDTQNQLRQDIARTSFPSRQTIPNGEIKDFAQTWPTSFHKGLRHNSFGLVADPVDFETFLLAVNHPDYPKNTKTIESEKNNEKGKVPKISPFDVGLGPVKGTFYTIDSSGKNWKLRKWESPLAGHQFDLEGPASGAVGMAAAPRLGSDELAGEMAEVYGLAIIRDTPFTHWDEDETVDNLAAALGQMEWFKKNGKPLGAEGEPISSASAQRRKTRRELTTKTMFRGSTEGCHVGPYISQFMLQGNEIRGGHGNRQNGKIEFGAQIIDQRVTPQAANVDYMVDWAEWLDVQDGADTRDTQAFAGDPRFITTPRDLATYVHFDALYQAYLNAALMMNGWKAKADRGLPETNHPTRDGFATFGGPHILTLVTETATRSLKAVRRQKYNFHNRARPEQLGAVANLVANGHKNALGGASDFANRHLKKLRSAKTKDFDLLGVLAANNAAHAPIHAKSTRERKFPDNIGDENLMLPMAFPEGSPMHPSYGAGHATVAGSCVTVLKAFFEMFKDPDGKTSDPWDPILLTDVIPDCTPAHAKHPLAKVFVPKADGSDLTPYQGNDIDKMTLMGELNKLAANISIGRNMAGVHYFSDYYDSLRMGERVAVGMLYEQAATYTEYMSMRFISFDDKKIEVIGYGNGTAEIKIDGKSDFYALDDWLNHDPVYQGALV